MKHTPKTVKHCESTVYSDTGKPVRPCCADSFLTRLKHAWHVLTGRFDVLDWE